MKLPIPIPARITLTGIGAAIVAGIIILLLIAFLAQRVVTYGMEFGCARIFGKDRCLINVEGWKPRALAAENESATFAADVREWTQIAHAAAEAHRIQQELIYSRIATEADINERDTTQRAVAAADRFAAMQPCPRPAAVGLRGPEPADRSDSRTAGASASDNDPVIPEALPADTFVSVTRSDLRACAAATAYAIEAHRWAVELEAASREGD